MRIGEIRLAGIKDIPAIQKIIDSVWLKNETNGDRIANVLADSMHATLVYDFDGVIAGFVDGFLTIPENGIQRWELDLLAVHTDYQRRGIASALITSNTQVGILRRAKLARGLVAVDNVGSQGAFARCGYETDGAIYELLVANKAHQAKDFETTQEDDFIRVNTINYSGLWIEGRQSRTRLKTAMEQLANSPYDLAGAVVPAHEAVVIEDSLTLGYERVGRYQWWQRSLIDI